MRQIVSVLVFWFCLVAPIGVAANTEEENGDHLAAALTAANAGDWVLADHYAGQISDPVGQDFVLWMRLRAGEGDWEEYQEFLGQHSEWPGLKLLRRRGEDVMPVDAEPASVHDFFATQPPQTGRGAKRLAAAFEAQGRQAESRNVIIKAWTDMTLTRQEQSDFQAHYNGVVSRHHQTRLTNLLWAGKTKEAARMLDLVPPVQADVARASIALQRGSKDALDLVASLSERDQDRAIIAYGRFRWLVKTDQWDAAEALLKQRTITADKLGRPEHWSDRRRVFARRALRQKDTSLAYILASKHGLNEGANYADLEWLSGYIALRFMSDASQAVKHFENFKAAVRSPISLGRAGYWLGLAYEETGNFDAATQAYELGAKYQTSFYGQLAAEKASISPDEELTGQSDVPDWRDAAFASSDVARIAVLLHYAQQQRMVRWFFTHMAETMDKTQGAQLAELALEMDRPFVALGVAKEVAKRGIVLSRPYFPVTDLATYSADVEAEVAMSIARRESELDQGAVSPAGARGLMQLMPNTAREVADQLGMEYSLSRLTTDWRYNATLGTAYLGSLLEEYGGSYIIAFAAYNAGPHRADRWLETYGDPRTGKIDPVDWIEQIPFRETRNYVMRVIEGLHVYRARMLGEAQVVSLSLDLSKG